LQKSIPKYFIPVALVCLLYSFSSCARRSDSELGEIDGVAIIAADFEKAAGKELFRQREILYRLEQRKLDEFISATLLSKEARSRGISTATLLEQEVTSKVLPVGEDEIETFYNANKAQLPIELNKVREQIGVYLRDQRTETKKAAFLNSLRSKAKITTYLQQPRVYRADVPVIGAPAKGAENAQVTIVKFEDFQCPFCKQAQPILTEILSRYNGKVRLVHKDLPLDSIHPQARQAAEAARCAGDEGKYWHFHDKLYASSPKIATADLNSYAKEVGLNQELFEKCLSGGKYKASVQKDLNDGTVLGLTGTPGFFVNGREIIGTQPFEAFAALIDEELAGRK
jgi:protein-disulfide isomerase